MRMLNNITAKICFAMAIVAAICVITGARHLIVIAIICTVLGIAHMADNQNATRP